MPLRIGAGSLNTPRKILCTTNCNGVGTSCKCPKQDKYSIITSSDNNNTLTQNQRIALLVRNSLGGRIQYGNNINARVNIIYKSANTKNKFVDGNYDPKNIFKTGKDSIEDFVFRYVEILNKKYIARQKSMEIRQLNKAAKKYNL